LKFFRDLKRNDIKQTKSELHQKITLKDLREEQRKAVNKYSRYLKEYDEDKTEEKYKELIQVHTELTGIEKQINELGIVSNEITDADFNIKIEDINQDILTTEKLGDPEPIKEIIPEPVIDEQVKSYQDGEFGYKEQNESTKCLFCDEKFGFTQDWNVHMMEKHPEDLIEYNKREIEKLSSENPVAKDIVEKIAITEEIFEQAEIKHENNSNTDPDLQVIQEEMVKRNIQTKEEYDSMMNKVEKNSPYAIHQESSPTAYTPNIPDDDSPHTIQKASDIQPLENKPQINPKYQELDEIIKKLEVLKKPEIPTESIIDLAEIIPAVKKIKSRDSRFGLSNIFKKRRHSKLKGIEAYCNICKHTVQQHEYQGKSEGCLKCGCLKTVQDILNTNDIDIKYGEKEEIKDNGIVCVCGHSQLTHKEQIKFCEVEQCHCVRFRTK
jgi:hypothetical protein